MIQFNCVPRQTDFLKSHLKLLMWKQFVIVYELLFSPPITLSRGFALRFLVSKGSIKFSFNSNVKFPLIEIQCSSSSSSSNSSSSTKLLKSC